MANALLWSKLLCQGVQQNADQVGIDLIGSQNFVDGEVVVYYSAATSNALQQGGTDPTNIVGVAMGAASAQWGSTGNVGAPFDTLMGTIENTGGHYFKARLTNTFEGTLLGKTLANADGGAQYGITRKTSPTAWCLDSTKTGTSVRATITGYLQNDVYRGGVGDSGARVLFQFVASATYWDLQAL